MSSYFPIRLFEILLCIIVFHGDVLGLLSYIEGEEDSYNNAAPTNIRDPIRRPVSALTPMIIFYVISLL